MSIIICLLLELVDFFEACDGRHESEESVDGNCHTRFTHEHGRFISFENLQVHRLESIIDDGPFVVEEFWVTTNLSEMRLSEGSFKDDIKNALHHRVLLVNELRVQESLCLC